MLKCSGQGRGAPNDAGGRPIAPPPGVRRAPERPHAAQQRPRAPGGLKCALKGPTAHLHAPTAYLRHAYAHLARRRRPSRPRAARAHAALGARLGGPVPPSHARARLGGCSARYRGLRGIYTRLRPTYAMPTPYKHAAAAYRARQPRAPTRRAASPLAPLCRPARHARAWWAAARAKYMYMASTCAYGLG